MIKINLLPKTINEKRIVKNTAILFGVLLLVIVVAGVLYARTQLAPKIEQANRDAEIAEALKKEVEGIEAERDQWKGKLPPIKQKLDFIKGVLDYNMKYPALYEQVARWTYEKVSYVSMVSNGTDIAMQARAKSLDDLGRFLLNMYQATDLFTEVTITGIPGYRVGASGGGGGSGPTMAPNPSTGLPADYYGPAGRRPGLAPVGSASMAGIGAINMGVQQGQGSGYIEFTVNCRLKTQIAPPSFTAAAAPAAGATGAMSAAPPPAGGGMAPP